MFLGSPTRERARARERCEIEFLPVYRERIKSLWMQRLCGEVGEILQYRPRIPANSEIRHPPIRTMTHRVVEKDETFRVVS